MLHHDPSDVRERLLDAAFRSAVANGVEAVSTRSVCSAVGVQAPTLYHHFGSRAGLISAVIDRAFEQYFAQKDARTPGGSTPAGEIAAGWDAHVAFARAYPGLYPATHPLSGTTSAHLERSESLLRAGFERLAAEGALAPGITPAVATTALRAALRGVAHAVATGQPDAELVSATVRDALVARLIDPDEGHQQT